MNQKKKLTDLLKDASFLRWLRAGRPGSDPEWPAWSKEDPEHEQLAEDAAAMEQGIPFRRQAISDDLAEQHWEGISARLDTEHNSTNRRHLLRWSAAAAVLLLLSVLGAQWLLGSEIEWTTHQTALGESTTLTLPDGSAIYLGANSKLQYPTDFLGQEDRLIYLEGEAYFEVEHQRKPKPFLVRTPALDVRVLGTQFNVNAHRPQPIVSLTHGSVQLSHPGTAVTKILELGQTAQYVEEQKQFVISTDDTDYWASWRTGKWQFGAGIAMTEVLQRIEETYGLKCIVQDSTILQLQLAGSASVESREELFDALSALLDLNFRVEGNELRIE